MYVNTFDEFERKAEHIYVNNPLSARCVMKYNHSGSVLMVKVTDNQSCVQYKTDTMQEFKKLEKFLTKALYFNTSKEAF